MPCILATNVPLSRILLLTTPLTEAFAKQLYIAIKPVPRISCRGQYRHYYPYGVRPQHGGRCQFVAGFDPSTDAKRLLISRAKGRRCA